MTSPGDTTVPLPDAEDLSLTLGDIYGGEHVYEPAVTFPGDHGVIVVEPAIDADPVEAIRDPRVEEAMEMLAKVLSFRRLLIVLVFVDVLLIPLILAGWAALIYAIVAYVRYR